MPSVVIDCLYAIKLLALEIKDLKKEVKELKEEFSNLLLCENCFYAKLHEGDWAECFLPENISRDGLESPMDGMQVYKKESDCKSWKSKK